MHAVTHYYFDDIDKSDVGLMVHIFSK